MSRADITKAVFVTVIWGINFVALKVCLEVVPPLALSALRFVLLAPLWLVVSPPKRAWRDLAVVGIALGVVKFSLLFWGMNAGVSAGVTSVVLQSQAVFTVAMGALMLGERFTWGQLVGGLIAGLGLLYVGLGPGASVSGLGLGLVLAAGAAWAWSNLRMKRARPDSMFRFMVWIAVFPPIPLLLLSTHFEGVDAWLELWRALDMRLFAALVYTSLVAIALGFGLWGQLLERYPASRVAPFGLLIPIFGLGASSMMLGEPLTLTKVVASGFVLAGLALVVASKPSVPSVKEI